MNLACRLISPTDISFGTGMEVVGTLGMAERERAHIPTKRSPVQVAMSLSIAIVLLSVSEGDGEDGGVGAEETGEAVVHGVAPFSRRRMSIWAARPTKACSRIVMRFSIRSKRSSM